MRKNIWIALALVLLLPAMLFTVSCAKQQVDTGEDTTAVAQPAPDTSGDDADKAKLEDERMKAEEQERLAMAARNAFINEDVYFEFDSSALLPMAQDLLAQKAEYLNTMPGLNVLIEGHCDDRGTEAYNMALGERRAQAVKDFLVNLGISAYQLDIRSYGEERPADMGQNEEAWAKNRRAHFVIK